MRGPVEFLADDAMRGRDAGSAEYEIAARYVAARFRELGLEPAGDGGTFLQPVPLVRSALDVPSTAVESMGLGGLMGAAALRQSTLADGSDRTTEGGATDK